MKKCNTLLYFNPNGDLIMDLSKKGNNPVIINQAKLCWLACQKKIKGRRTLLNLIINYFKEIENVD